MPLVKAMANAKINKSQPLNLATKEVLKPIIKPTPNPISNMVDAQPIKGMNDCGINGFRDCVYARKLFQLPHAETSLLQKPKRSATADKNPIPIDNRKKSFIILLLILF